MAGYMDDTNKIRVSIFYQFLQCQVNLWNTNYRYIKVKEPHGAAGNDMAKMACKQFSIKQGKSYQLLLHSFFHQLPKFKLMISESAQEQSDVTKTNC